MKKIFNYFILIFFVICTILLSWNAPLIKASEVFPFSGIINADSLVVYSEASTSSAKLTELVYGTSIVVLEDASSKLYKISFDNGTIGYTWKSYIINVDNAVLTTDAPGSGMESYVDYCNSLIALGFEKSYCPYLYYLHSKHPHWNFVPDVLNMTLEEAAIEQTDRSVLATNNQNYWLNNNTHEGSYHYVNASVTASFLDPRNSLFEETIFQFLDFQSSKALANDLAMSKIAGSGNLSNYYEAFKKAGVDNGVNPLHLMARSKQEGANDASYNSVAGIFTTNVSSNPTYAYNRTARGNSLDGYYNYYNIGAWYGSGYSAIGRGLAYAGGFLENDNCYDVINGIGIYNVTTCGTLSYMRPWNSPEQAIAGGANFISETYVKMGQNTNYYEKFNVSARTQYPLYSHQYMTNIHAPASEANSLWNAIVAGSLENEAFEFHIPVYKNMPEDNYQAVDKNTNSKLSSVTINDKAYVEFDKDVTEYNYNLVTDVDTFKIEAKTESSTSGVVGIGDYTFVDGVAIVTLVVTAEDGSTTTYVINVKKVVPEQVVAVDGILSKMDVKVDGNFMFGISPDVAVTTLINTVTKNGGEASVVDLNGNVKTSGVFSTGDSIVIKGTTESKTFIISVRGDVNKDGKITILDLLLVQKHILEKTVLTNEQYYAAELNFDNKITILDLLLVQKHILEKGKL
jgi:beta-N-acetylglucosaminidase